ncbi:hypothetical protein [Brachybacterium sacelli]|uniref:Uncharacterized protein n=1 Tax=Brachybacterium sacelli TaxID=173364 RepID=A0ABS4X231_9MICO|nr:hypothetical protein [Brachybacterium sacelli]MBP2382514.1 hypothetical protein [Brachybacterium sacelli]
MDERIAAVRMSGSIAVSARSALAVGGVDGHACVVEVCNDLRGGGDGADEPVQAGDDQHADLPAET